MIKLFILLTIAFLIVILILPASVCIDYNNKKLNMSLLYLFLKINILNQRNKKAKKKSNNKIQKISSKKKVITFLKVIKSVPIILTFIKIILKKINFQKLYVILLVSSDTSEKCATSYFYARTFIYYISRILKLKNKIKKFRVRVIPTFLGENSDLKLSIVIKISPLMILLIISEFIHAYLSQKTAKKD